MCGFLELAVCLRCPRRNRFFWNECFDNQRKQGNSALSFDPAMEEQLSVSMLLFFVAKSEDMREQNQLSGCIFP